MNHSQMQIPIMNFDDDDWQPDVLGGECLEWSEQEQESWGGRKWR